MALPDDFDQRFPFLQHLNLEHNQFAKLPACLQNLPNLTGIWLQDNPLEEVDMDIFAWPNLRAFSVDSNVPLFVDTCCVGYYHKENPDPVSYPNPVLKSSHNIFISISGFNSSCERESRGFPIREYPNIFEKKFHAQIFARPIECYLPALLDGSLDPLYYHRFAQECSPSLRIFLRENLPRASANLVD